MFRKIINTFGTRLLGAILNFLIAVVISQTVGDVGKGEQALLLMDITFVLIFSDIISGSSIVYLAPKHNFSKIVMPAYLWSLLIGLFSIVMFPLVGGEITWTLAANVGILSVLSSLASVNTSVLIGRERVNAANAVNLWQPVTLLLTLLVCYYGFGMLNLNAYIIALYVAYGGSWIFGIILLHNEFKEFTFYSFNEYKVVVKDLFKYGILNQSGHLVQFINLRLGFYLLQRYVDTGSTGVFSNAVALAEAVWLVSRSIALVQYARIANSDDLDYSRRLTLDLSKICLAFSSLGIIVLALLPACFHQWLFGPEFGTLPILIRILAPGALMYTLSIMMEHFFSGIGRYQMDIYAALCGLVFTFALGFTLIPRYGIYGAAITSSVSYAANAVFMLIAFFRKGNFRIVDLFISKKNISEFVQIIKNQYNK
ncbi:MAG: polysaccharide biosynthesis C-terminal domain-containing protein [Bacteroidales bacterium]|nr:polysaccharide biosynthesis C-terminal domain-containing protein [Bacteroidales bacterium]